MVLLLFISIVAQIGDQISSFLFILNTGKGHLCSYHISGRTFQKSKEMLFSPVKANSFHGLGIGEGSGA